jgi:glycosyltransferase involved in cell wall biosynthesis
MQRLTAYIADYSGSHKYLTDCILSLNEQTFTDFKIDIDDREEVHAFPKWNTGIEKCETEYLCFPGADDIYHHNWLNECITYLDTHPNTAAVYTIDFLIDSNGDRLPGGTTLPIKEKSEYTFSDIFYGIITHGNFLRFPSGVYRMSAIKNFRFLIDNKLGGAADTYGYFDIMNRGWNIGIINKPLFKCRQHSKQYSQSQREDGPIDHWYAMDMATELRPEVRTWEIHVLLSKLILENQSKEEEIRINSRAKKAQGIRFLIVHEVPENAGTGVLVAQRCREYNLQKDNFISYYVFPDLSENSGIIREGFYKGIPIISCKPSLFPTIINKYKPDDIEIHHTMRWGLKNLSYLLNSPYISNTKLYLHDSFLWCGRWHQMDYNNKYCDGATNDKCNVCVGITDEDFNRKFNELRYFTVKIGGDKIFTNSKWLQEQATNHLGFPVGVYEWDIPKLNKTFKGKKVGYFGGAYPVKGFNILMEAARRLPYVQFILFCDLPEHMLDNKRIYGYDNILVMGKYKRDDIPYLTNLIDIAVVPSIIESFGILARELQACNILVIITKTGGMNEIGNVEPDNVCALVDAIKTYTEEV